MKALANHSTLTHLSLDQNPLGDKSVDVLFQTLASNRHSFLKSLSLKKTNLSSESLKSISLLLLAKKNHLKSLSLSQNSLQEIDDLHQGLKKNKTLQILELREINLNSETALRLSKFLPKWSLTQLDLSANSLIGEESARKLLKGFEHNSTLTSFHVDFWTISSELRKEYDQVRKKRLKSQSCLIC